eukprot:3940358-Rhodomonas_salina.7
MHRALAWGWMLPQCRLQLVLAFQPILKQGETRSVPETAWQVPSSMKEAVLPGASEIVDFRV